MANTIRCFNLILGSKSNRYRGHKWILIFLKLRELIKGLVKE